MTGTRIGCAVGAVLLAAGALTGCRSGSASMDCGKSALTLAGDLQDVTGSVTNVGNIADSSHRETSQAVAKLRHDADAMAADSHDPAQRRAAEAVARQASAVDAAVDDGRTPHLGALANAVGAWTKTCGADG